MSYEGYVQALCKNGHYMPYDEPYEEEGPDFCPICRAERVWSNSVDDTNGDNHGAVSMKELEISQCESTTTVENGKYVTRIVHAVYRIPSDEETKKLRNYQ